jgi:hypothetical protein
MVMAKKGLIPQVDKETKTFDRIPGRNSIYLASFSIYSSSALSASPVPNSCLTCFRDCIQRKTWCTNLGSVQYNSAHPKKTI